MTSQSQHPADPDLRRVSIVDFWIGEDGHLLERLPRPPETAESCVLDQPVPRTSYVHGSRSFKVVYATLPELLERRSEEDPEREAHVFWMSKDDKQLRRISVSFSQLSERSALLAAGFLDIGLRPGERIAIAGENCPDWLYATFAAMRIGVCPVLLASCRLTNQSSLKRLVLQLRCRALIVNPGTDDDVIRKLECSVSNMKCDVMHVIRMGERWPGTDATSIQNLITKSGNMEEVIRIQDGLDPESVAISYFASESNNCMELVSQSHFAFINNTLAANNGLWQSDSRLYDDQAFFGIRSSLLSAVCLGLTTIHVDTATIRMVRDNDFLYSIMEKERVTACVASWAIIDKARQSGEAVSGFPACMTRILIYGTASWDDRLNFCRKTFKQTIHFYCNPGCGIAARRIVSKETSIPTEGQYMEPLVHTEIKVIDDEGRIRPLEGDGVLCIRSLFANNVSYLSNQVQEGGLEGLIGIWIRTDDLAIVHKCGGVQIIGQKEDVIVYNGVTIYPHHYEVALRKMTQVKEASVISIPDEKSGQELGACVMLHSGQEVNEEEFAAHCTRSGLDPSPRYFLILKDFPRLSNGEVDRKALRIIMVAKCFEMYSITQ